MGSKIDLYLNYVEDCIYKFFKYILGKDYKYSLLKPFVDRYIEVRYYNDTNYKDKELSDRLSKEFKKIANSIIKKEEDNEDLIKNICALFGYVLYIDDASEYRDLKMLVNDILDNGFVDVDYEIKSEFTSFLKEMIEKKREFHKIFETNDFHLEFKRVKKSVNKVYIKSDVEISKLYSSYAIDKAFNEGMIAEDKIFVLVRLLSEKILNDAINLVYNNFYIVNFPKSFFSKKKKIKRLFAFLNNDLIKFRICLKVKYKDYLEYKDVINDYIKDGYNFALELDESFDNSFDCFVLFKFILLYEYLECYDVINDDKESFNTCIITL